MPESRRCVFVTAASLAAEHETSNTRTAVDADVNMDRDGGAASSFKVGAARYEGKSESIATSVG